MASPDTQYVNFAAGTITDNPLGSGDTTINSSAFADLPALDSPNGEYFWLTLDPEAEDGAPEIVQVTSHSAAATSVTVTRGQQGTTARAHVNGTVWRISWTKADAEQVLVSPVATAELADGAVTEPKIGTGAVTENKIGALAVATAALKALAVTEPKMADDSVSERTIVDGSVANVHHKAEEWTDFNPDLEATTTGPSFTSQAGRYQQRGKTVIGVIEVIANTSTAGSGDYTIDLPVVPRTTGAAGLIVGSGWARGRSSNAEVYTIFVRRDGKLMIVNSQNSNGVWSSSSNVTFADVEALELYLQYEAA